MQQPLGVAPLYGHAATGGGASGRVAHPVARYGLVFGLLNGLFGILQVVTSSSGAIENHATISSFYYSTHGTGFDIAIMARWLAPVLSAAYGSCLVAFAISMWLCWHAGRASAITSGYSAGASVAGLLASVVGSGIWIVASVVAVLLLHTDATFSGVLTTTPDSTSAHQTVELVGLLTQEIVAAAIALGFAAIAGHMGGQAAHVPSREFAPRAFMRAYPPYPPAIMYPPYPPGGYPASGMQGAPPWPPAYSGVPPTPAAPPRAYPDAPFPPYSTRGAPSWERPRTGDPSQSQTGAPRSDDSEPQAGRSN